MKTFLQASLLSATIAFSTAHLRAADSVTPYLEAAPVSFLCNFTLTGLSSSRVPLPVGGAGVLDPDKLRPLDRISTDVAAPIVYAVSNGDQAFFVKHLLRAAIERFAQQYKSIAENQANALADVSNEIIEIEANIAAINAELGATTDPAARETLNTQKTALTATLATKNAEFDAIAAPYNASLAEVDAKIEYLKTEASDQWEITSVRNAQSTLSGAASTPFALFLTRTDRIQRGISQTFDTGLRLVPIYSSGASTETRSSGTLTKVTGSYVTHLSLDFTSFYANDPLSAVSREDRAVAQEGEDFNTSGEFWRIDASGYMSYTLRSTPGPVIAIYPSGIKLTGHGSWEHYPDLTSTNPPSYAGIAPFSIKIGAVKYLNRNIFPEFTGE